MKKETLLNAVLFPYGIDCLTLICLVIRCYQLSTMPIILNASIPCVCCTENERNMIAESKFFNHLHQLDKFYSSLVPQTSLDLFFLQVNIPNILHNVVITEHLSSTFLPLLYRQTNDSQLMRGSSEASLLG